MAEKTIIKKGLFEFSYSSSLNNAIPTLYIRLWKLKLELNLSFGSD